MRIYANLDGRSSIEGYDEAYDSITVYFTDGSAYEYTYDSAGVDNVEEMKELAHSGEGLNSFIMRNVRNGYSRRVY